MLKNILYYKIQENRVFGERKNPIFDFSGSNQMLLKDQIMEIAPHVRTYF